MSDYAAHVVLITSLIDGVFARRIIWLQFSF